MLALTLKIVYNVFILLLNKVGYKFLQQGDNMKVIYLHHGQRSMGNPPSQNDKLTRLGYKDCKLTARLFVDIKDKIKAIYTSNFYRCTKTAQILNKKLKKPIILEPRLNEFGSVPGESWADLQTRIIAFLNEITKQYSADDYVVCVTSGVNLGAFMCKAFNIAPSQDTPFLIVPSCSIVGFNYN